jgi:hypothetical protein
MPDIYYKYSGLLYKLDKGTPNAKATSARLLVPLWKYLHRNRWADFVYKFDIPGFHPTLSGNSDFQLY